MTLMNTFEDLLRLLETRPDLRDQLRSHILTEELLQLPARLIKVENDLAELKSDVKELKAGQDRLETRMTGVETRMDDMATRMNRMDGNISNIMGHQYETDAIDTALSRASEILHIRRPRIAKSQRGRENFFAEIMEDAIDAGQITLQEYARLNRTDIIITSRQGHHAVIEASLGPNQEDLQRARDRADILQRATGATVTAVVATPQPHPAFVALAESQGITVFDIRAKQYGPEGVRIRDQEE